MTAVACPGLRASSPMGAIAAWGALELLSRHRDPGARLGWVRTDHGMVAALDTVGASDHRSLADSLADALLADDLTALAAIAPDVNKVIPDDLRAALRPDAVPDAASRLVAALTSEFPRRDDGQAARSPLIIGSFKGRRSVFGAAVRADEATTAHRLFDLLRGPWVYSPGVATFGWDPDARQQDSARLGVDASADGTRGAHGALSLALRGCALIAPLPARGRRPHVAAAIDGHFAWPTWTTPLSRQGVVALLARRWATRTPAGLRRPGVGRDDPLAVGCTVQEVWASAIVDAKDGRRLARARLVP